MNSDDQLVPNLEKADLAEMYRMGILMKAQGLDLTKPSFAAALARTWPRETRDTFRTMVAVMNMDPPLGSPEWEKLTRTEQGKVLVRSITSMPEDFWTDA